MRILVVTNMYPAVLDPCGVFVANQVLALRAAGLDVDTLLINPRRTRWDYGIKVLPLVRRLRAGHYDVVHTHHTYSLLVVELARRLAGLRIPVVLTNHEAEATDAGHRTRTWHPTSYLRHSLALKRFAARRANFVIFVSSQVAAAVAPDVKHEIIPCGVDLDTFQPLDRTACRTQLGISSRAPVIFFPTNPKAAYKRFPLARAAYDVVRRHEPEAILLTAGSIPHREMALYYNAADVVLQTSYCEASPAVIREALACEVPVVSTDAGDAREILDGVRSCFVCRDDPVDLAEHVLRCLGHRDIGGRERLRARGLAVDQVASRVINVYRQLA